MSASFEYLERCAAETGFQVAALEKVVRLGGLAADISRHPLLGESLALKGGTALNLGFGPPHRLSVDLDFNYIAHVGRETMLADRPLVEEAVVLLAQRQGFRVQKSRDAFAGRKLHLWYRSVLGQDDRVEVDLNYLFRAPLDDPAPLELWQPGDLDRPSVRAVGIDEILIGKVLALLDRSSPRDAWDIAMLAPATGAALSTPRLKRRFVALTATLDQPLATFGRARLETALTDQAVAAQLIPMLAAGSRPSAATLVEEAWTAIAPLLQVDADETAYLAAIEAGDLRPELLFADDPALAARLAEHPALQWKVANVRRHLGKG